MSVLDSVIKYKQLEKVQEAQNAKIVTDAIGGFLEQRNQLAKMEQERRDYDLKVRDTESLMKQRAKGSVLDQVEEANAIQTWAIENKDPALFDAVGNHVRSLLPSIDNSSKDNMIKEDGTIDAPKNITPPTEETSDGSAALGAETVGSDVAASVKKTPKLEDKYTKVEGNTTFKATKLDWRGDPDGWERVEELTEKQKLDNEALADKKKEHDEKNLFKTQKLLKSTNDSIATIDTIIEGIDSFGLTGSLPSIPGTDRVKWEQNVKKLKATLILDVMRDLKEASATGSTGFGQLSDKERQILEDAATALSRNMKPEHALEILNEMKVELIKVRDGGKKKEEGATFGKFTNVEVS